MSQSTGQRGRKVAKRLPVQILFGLMVAFSLLIWDQYTTYRIAIRDHHDVQAKRMNALPSQLRIVYEHMQNNGNMKSVRGLLEDLIKTERIAHYVIYHDRQVYETSFTEQVAQEFKPFLMPERELSIHQSGAFIWSEMPEGFQIALVVHQNNVGYISNLYERYWKSIVLYLVVAFAISIVAFIWNTRDIFGAIKQLGRRDRRGLAQMTAGSREAEILQRGLMGFNERVHELEAANQELGRVLLPSLKKEISTGRRPPYDFDCTLVRVDINNFSHIFNTQPVTPFMETINEFFLASSHIIARYRGLVHEFVGDEIIFYIKDDDFANSVLGATLAVRDIMGLASGFHLKTMAERGYPFTVKATLAHGRLRFGRLVNGYSLAGSVLIETVRVLSHIIEKDGNVLVFDERMCERLGPDEAVCADYADVQLKGFQGVRRLVRLESVPGLEAAWEKRDWAALSLRRSDAEIQKLMDWLVEAMKAGEHELCLRLIGVLRQVPVSDPNPDRSARVAAVVNEVLKTAESRQGGERQADLKVLSGVLKVLENLIPPGDWLAETEAMVRRAMNTRDRRVIANALDVLTVFKSETDPEFGLRLIKHVDNRIAANALVKEGIRELTPKVVKELRRMLIKSEEPGRQASAIYALGEITKFYHEADPVYLEVQVDFLALLERLEPFLKSENDMIRRQAQSALKKAGRLPVDAILPGEPQTRRGSGPASAA